MKHPAVDELIKIMKTRDWTEFCPERDRQAELEVWIAKWLIQVEQSQLVVDVKYLDSESLDFVKYRMGQVLGEALTEDCVTFKTEKKRVTAKMVGIRRAK